MQLSAALGLNLGVPVKPALQCAAVHIMRRCQLISKTLDDWS